MNPAVTFHEDARTEFDEAANFYNMERAGLGVAFVHEVERPSRTSVRIPRRVRSFGVASARCAFTGSRMRFSTPRSTSGFACSPSRTIVGDRSIGADASSMMLRTDASTRHGAR